LGENDTVENPFLNHKVSFKEFNAKLSFIKHFRLLSIMWFLVAIFLIIFIYLQYTQQIELFGVSLLLLIILLVFSYIMFRYYKRWHYTTLFDDMDYANIRKLSLDFYSNDILHAAYLCLPSDIADSESLPIMPAVIGFHGWGAYHRRMDRFCLPHVRKNRYYYFTFDSRGHGLTPGSKADMRSFKACQDFIKFVSAFKFVKQDRIAIVGTSLGSATAAYAGYKNPNVKALALMAGPFDLVLTLQKWPKIIRMWEKIPPLTNISKILEHYSTMKLFDPEGIDNADNSSKIPNSERVFLACCLDDTLVTCENTKQAIERLRLPSANYRIFTKGKHLNIGNEFDLAVDVFDFITKRIEKNNRHND